MYFIQIFPENFNSYFLQPITVKMAVQKAWAAYSRRDVFHNRWLWFEGPTTTQDWPPGLQRACGSVQEFSEQKLQERQESESPKKLA